jgi:hypothetical protein
MDPMTAILVALIAAIPGVLAAVPAIFAAKRAGRAEQHAKNADDAVNHRKEGEPRLVEMVSDLHSRQGVLEAALLHHLVVDHNQRGG